MKKHRIDACDLIFLCTLIPITFFLLWKCPYGYGGLDEPFYLTLAQRLSMGDALLSDEWNLSQLSAVLLLPFYRLHRLLFGTTEGIVLHFRYLYTAVQLLTAALMYLALRRFRYGAVCAVLIFAIYTPYDVMALSYNTFALMAVTLCLSILSCCKKDGRAGFLLAGFCYAVSVIANPYIFLIYLFVLVSYFAAFCVRAFRRRQNVRSAPRDLPSGTPSASAADTAEDGIFHIWGRGLLIFTIGAAVPAIYLFILVFSRAGISTILNNLSAILQDPEHASRSAAEILYSIFYAMRSTFGMFIAVWFLLTALSLIDRKKTHAWMYFCMTALITATAVMIYIPSIQTDYNYIMFPITLCGLSAYLLTSKKNHRVFLFLWCFGMFYAFCLGCASNQGGNAICMGMPAAAAGSVLLIRSFIKEQFSLYRDFEHRDHTEPDREASGKTAGSVRMKTNRFTAPLAAGVAALLFLSQLGAECYAKAVHAFWEPSVDALDIRITGGPLKGVYTTKEHADAYDMLLTEIEPYRNGSDSPVLFVSSSPWCYLYADRPYGVYSSWISTLSSDSDIGAPLLIDRLGEYYRLHPDRIPTDIYIAKNDIWGDRLYGTAEWKNGYPLAAWLLTYTNIDPSPLYPHDCEEWKILYSVTESGHGFHMKRIILPD